MAMPGNQPGNGNGTGNGSNGNGSGNGIAMFSFATWHPNQGQQQRAQPGAQPGAQTQPGAPAAQPGAPAAQGQQPGHPGAQPGASERWLAVGTWDEWATAERQVAQLKTSVSRLSASWDTLQGEANLARAASEEPWDSLQEHILEDTSAVFETTVERLRTQVENLTLIIQASNRPPMAAAAAAAAPGPAAAAAAAAPAPTPMPAGPSAAAAAPADGNPGPPQTPYPVAAGGAAPPPPPPLQPPPTPGSVFDTAYSGHPTGTGGIQDARNQVLMIHVYTPSHSHLLLDSPGPRDPGLWHPGFGRPAMATAKPRRQ